jgi:hypothetical protein
LLGEGCHRIPEKLAAGHRRIKEILLLHDQTKEIIETWGPSHHEKNTWLVSKVALQLKTINT